MSGKDLPSRRIAEELRRRIAAGEFTEDGKDGKLPSERKLAADHDAARNTVREAIRQLAEQGLVDTHHGKGVFVRRRRQLLRFGDRYSKRLREETGVSPYRAELAKQGLTPRVDCPSITRVSPPSDVAERLGLSETDSTVARRENWYYAVGEGEEFPVQIGITYIPWEIAEGSVLSYSADMGKGSLYARFEDLGHPIAASREEVSARMPDPDEAEGLSIPDGVPVLEILHTGIDDQGRPFEVTKFVIRADVGGLDYTVPVKD
ncbi:GntR family transcriptional regulator [Nocardiopsis suaedae]|uniref:GntR family transcriptional regulator n=1 Tax=Nocardiopsis suaedae TaxID=3018444 RepID=A0ABT4TJZ8_9ACTN|nr:GntR family transcriptional regulator [Nocardiopsis suaedae]MDA2804447.1 GntR family transcriptional regulator [Nocardiopsis suaedae]